MKHLFLIFICSLSFYNLALAGSHQELSEEKIYEVLKYASNDPSYEYYIKFSIILDSSGNPKTIWFQDQTFPFHHDFLTTLPEFKNLTKAQIETLAMKNTGRRLWLGSLLKPKNNQAHGGIAGPFHFEILSSDPIGVAEVHSVLSILQKKANKIVTDFSYLPSPENRAKALAEKNLYHAAGIKLVEMSSKNFLRACYSQGWAYGTVKRVRSVDYAKKWNAKEISASDILVMDEAPRELNQFAALVVSAQSSPSSHPVLLAEMSGSPFIYEQNAFESEYWKKAEATPEKMFLRTLTGGFSNCNYFLQTSSQMTPKESQRLLELKRPVPVVIAPYQRTQLKLKETKSLSLQDAPTYGAKAAQLGLLMQWIPSSSPEKGLAVPIEAFLQFLEKSEYQNVNLKLFVQNKLTELAQNSDKPEFVQNGLLEIRSAIESSPVPNEISQTLLSLESVFARGSKIKLRSSSNAEDSLEFNGAGLYESESACVGDDHLPVDAKSVCDTTKNPKPILLAAKKVWASLYTEQAFWARHKYSIKESSIGMGIAIQASYRGETANGVAISEDSNDWSGDKTQVTATGFPGENLSVTNPPVGKIPESTLLTNDRSEILVHSTEIPHGRTLLAEEKYRELYNLTSLVHDKYRKLLISLGKLPTGPLKLDTEWKEMPQATGSKIILKQVRPVPDSGSALTGKNIFRLTGGTQLRLCPSISERADALAKLQVARPARIDLAGLDLPEQFPAQIPNPVLAFSWQTSDGREVLGKSSASAQISATNWQPSGQPNLELRYLTLSAEVLLLGLAQPNQKLTLTWQITQSKTFGKIEKSVLSLISLPVTIAGNSFGQESSWYSHASLNSQAACEADLYNGFQEDFSIGVEAHDWIVGRAPPVNKQTKILSSDGKFSLNFVGRTSSQGMDKTMFIHMDKTEITGILPRTLTVKLALASVYAPAHHNFAEEWGIDLLAAEALNESERAALNKKNLRYLLVTLDQDAPQPSRKMILWGVSDQGQKRKLTVFPN